MFFQCFQPTPNKLCLSKYFFLPLVFFLCCIEHSAFTFSQMTFLGPQLTQTYSAFLSQPDFFADGFDYPLGKPNAKGYRLTQKFGNYYKPFNSFHLGEDYNGVKAGNNHLGDPVYACADGIVFFAEDYKRGWGNVVRILHKVRTSTGAGFIESLYGHFQKIMVKPGQFVKRGQQIGTLGNANGLWTGHLHLEFRNIFLPIGGGYSSPIQEGFIAPSTWINRNRPKL